MVKNAQVLEQFELELVRSSPPDFNANLRIVEALYQEARNLGVLPRPDPLEGIEHIIELARAINSV
jgi:hypothetical protein